MLPKKTLLITTTFIALTLSNMDSAQAITESQLPDQAATLRDQEANNQQVLDDLPKENTQQIMDITALIEQLSRENQELAVSLLNDDENGNKFREVMENYIQLDNLVPSDLHQALRELFMEQEEKDLQDFVANLTEAIAAEKNRERVKEPETSVDASESTEANEEEEVVVEEPIEEPTEPLMLTAQVQTQRLSADQYYKQSIEARQASTAWEVAQAFKRAYPNDSRVPTAINHAAERNMSLGESAHGKKDYNLAIAYYKRLINEPLVNANLRAKATVYHQQAANKETIKTANQYYNQSIEARQASTAWELAQDFKRVYPTDKRVVTAINRAAERNMSLGESAHKKGNYTLAIAYYNRLVNEPLVNGTLQSKVTIYHRQASNQETLKTADEYYMQIIEARQASTAWELAQAFKRDYPSDNRVGTAINRAAERNMSLGESAHRKENYTLATAYYNRLVNEGLVNVALRGRAITYHRQATNQETLKTADEYYLQTIEARQASTAWELAQNFKRDYPADSRVGIVMNRAAERNLSLGESAHKQGNYHLATAYYSRLLNEPLVHGMLRTEATTYHRQATSQETLKTADDYYKLVREAGQARATWELAQRFKEDYPNDTRLSESMTLAGEMVGEIGVRYHTNKDFGRANELYALILNEDHIDHSVIDEVKGYANQAARNQALVTPQDYYEKILNTRQASDAWALAQTFKKDFPTVPLYFEAVNTAAIRSLNLGIESHQAGNYALASLYYMRLVNEETISNDLNTIANKLMVQADNKIAVTAPSWYVNQSLQAKEASEAWRYALEGIALYPSHSGITDALNRAADRNLSLGIAAHERKNYSLAIKYYERITYVNEVDRAIRTKADSYKFLAQNNLQLTNAIVRSTNYNVSLDQAVEQQMRVKPQTSSSDYRWVDASKSQVSYYMNPLNFLPQNSGDIRSALITLEIMTNNLNVRTGPGTTYHVLGKVHKGEKYTIIGEADGWYNIKGKGFEGWVYNSPSYVKMDNSIMQFLLLSGSSGISVRDLNEELTGMGILSGHGETFQRASREANINEAYLIAHAMLETGRGTSALATGIIVEEVDGQKVIPRKVYNMYGIGAYDSNANKFGSEMAYKLGWFTPEEAIIGGAKWISNGYINNAIHKQDTLYKMRWNPSNPGTHQYATDIGWAYKQVNSLNNIIFLSQKYDLILQFDIPVYLP